MLEHLLTDTWRALRSLRRAPAFSASAIGTVAITLGAAATLFSLYNALALRALPVSDPSRLVLLQASDPKGPNRTIYEQTFHALRDVEVLDGLYLFSGGGMFEMAARNAKDEGLIEAITPGLHEALGLRPFQGRFLRAEDDRPGAEPVAVLSYELWRRLFHEDPAAIGERVTIGGDVMTVVGVTPPAFKGFYVDGGFGFTVSMNTLNYYLGSDPKRPVRGLQAVGRLRPDVTLAQAQAAIEARWQTARVEHVPGTLPALERQEIATHLIRVESLSGGISSLRVRYRQPLALLLGITVMLLAIGGVNLGGLLLSRAAERDHEFAVLLALGASRGQFVRQVMAESVALAVAGALLAVPLAFWSAGALTAMILPSGMTLAFSPAPDARVLMTLAAAAIVLGGVIGVVPAVSAGRRRPLALRANRTATPSGRGWPRVLLAAQVALSLVLVSGALLFAVSLANLRQVDRGYTTDGMRWARLFGVTGGYVGIDEPSYYLDLTARIEALPQIQSVSMAGLFPTFFSAPQFLSRQPVTPDGAAPGTDAVDSLVESVTPRFFETTGIALRRGRDFAWSEGPGTEPVVIVNERLARTLFADRDALGQYVRVGRDPAAPLARIIGVAADATIGDLRQPGVPVVFRSRVQDRSRVPVLIYRTDAGTDADTAVAAIIAAAGRERPRRFYAMADFEDEALTQERMLAGLSGFFGAVAAFLAFVGLYGSLRHAVASRTREFGVRLALGATPARILRMVLREGALIAGVGVLLGIPASLAASRFASSLLYGLTATDPRVLIASAAVLLALGMAASARPAWRAARLDPAATLRGD